MTRKKRRGSALDDLDDEKRELLSARSQPRKTTPMLATLTDEHFSSPDWIYERKLDGVRCLIHRDGGSVRILSRNGNVMNDSYPELVEAVADQPADDFIADGEIVAFDGSVTSFARLQGRMNVSDPDQARRTGIAVYLYLFDLPYLDGHDTTGLPLRTRKRLLSRTIRFGGRLRYTRHRNRDGKAYLKEACRKGWEGLIAKRADSRYVHKRSRDWLKLKCVAGQELVIGGFTEPGGSRRGFGALLVGYYADGDLRYAGKVGTGFDDELLESLRARMDRLERETSPFSETPKENDAHWITPRLVAEIRFTEWTRDGKLRHPRFIGLRKDKPAHEVRRERP